MLQGQHLRAKSFKKVDEL